MSKVIEIKNKQEVRSIRDSAWEENAQNWSKSRDLPFLLKDHIYKKICEKITVNGGLLIDIGCGNAWIVNHLFDNNVNNFEYLGLEINSHFINSNVEKYRNKESINFRLTDLEKPIDFEFTSFKKLQYFIACLSFIELIDLDKAFLNVSKLMNDNDELSVVVLDPYFEIFRMSNDFNDFESNILNLVKFDQSYYRKEIILGKNLNFKKEYIGLLHKMEDYILHGNQNDMLLKSIDNINCYNEKTKKGTIYKVLNFIKS